MSAEGARDVVPVAPLPTTVGLHGNVSVFDPTQEEWGEYTERLVYYFTANVITSQTKQRAVLLNAVGLSTYRLLKTLASPAQVTDLTFEQIVERAKKHFNPKPSPIVKRFEFNTRQQDEGESVAVFVAELRKIAQYCDYGDVLSDMLRDRVVCGLANKAVQRRLLQEPTLTFEKALEVALAAETAARDSRLQTTITVNGNPLTMEVVTGASVSIINRTTFDRIRNGQSTLDLNESNVRLSTYTGEPIEVEGSTIVQVEHNDQSLSLPLIVTKGDGPTLLGRDWLLLLRLDWHNI